MKIKKNRFLLKAKTLTLITTIIETKIKTKS